MRLSAGDRAAGLFEELDAIGAAAEPGQSFDAKALDLIAEAGLAGLVVPTEAGGVDLPLPEAIEVWAELARADGSIGWCAFAIDAALSYLAAYLPEEGLAVLLDGREPGDLPRVAGQFAPNGNADAEGDDWILEGEYQFGSGITLADFAGAGFFAHPADGGDPAYLMGFVPIAEIEQKGNWDVLGLRSTRSIDYAIHGARVPDHCTFDFFSPTVHRGSAKHHLGVLPVTATGHAGWALGVSRRMLDELTAVAANRTRMGATSSMADSDHLLISLARLESRWRSARAWMLEVAEEAEAECAASGEFVSVPTANVVRQACVYANREAVDISREAYGLAGTPALRDGPLQRCFRDLQAGAQHFFASDAPSVEWARGLLEAHRG